MRTHLVAAVLLFGMSYSTYALALAPPIPETLEYRKSSTWYDMNDEIELKSGTCTNSFATDCDVYEVCWEYYFGGPEDPNGSEEFETMASYLPYDYTTSWYDAQLYQNDTDILYDTWLDTAKDHMYMYSDTGLNYSQRLDTCSLFAVWGFSVSTLEYGAELRLCRKSSCP